MYQSMNKWLCPQISSDAWNVLPSPSHTTHPTGNEMHLLFIYLLIIYFSRTEVWTGSLAHTRSALYHWTPARALASDILIAQVLNCFLSSYSMYLCLLLCKVKKCLEIWHTRFGIHPLQPGRSGFKFIESKTSHQEKNFFSDESTPSHLCPHLFANNDPDFLLAIICDI